MTSTKSDILSRLATRPDWRAGGFPYLSLNRYLQHVFGHRVHRVSVDARLGCPNVVPDEPESGCIFCNVASFSPSRRLPPQPVARQIDEGISRLKRRFNCDAFIAYFQPATNTFAPVDTLRSLFDEALSHPKIVGLAVGTRPDCAGPDVLDLLERFARHTYVSVEFGLQSIHDRSLAWLGRGHTYETFLQAVERCRGRGFEVGAHVILGIPGETGEEIRATARELARLEIDAVKVHNLYAVADTRLAQWVESGEVVLAGPDEYVGWLVDFLERLPTRTIVQRITGEAPGTGFVGPAWCRDKPRVLAAVVDEFRRRGSRQGHLHTHRPNG